MHNFATANDMVNTPVKARTEVTLASKLKALTAPDLVRWHSDVSGSERMKLDE